MAPVSLLEHGHSQCNNRSLGPDHPDTVDLKRAKWFYASYSNRDG
jgi:hypothetical protein